MVLPTTLKGKGSKWVVSGRRKQKRKGNSIVELLRHQGSIAILAYYNISSTPFYTPPLQ